MPGGPLTEAQRRELRELLERSLEELERELAAARDSARPVDLGLSIGRLSRVDALQQQHMALARRPRMEARRVQLRGALARVDGDSYGLCVRCEEEIAYARLKARPEATLCRGCQARGAG